jgi:ketol-acid reductoisomerase
MKKEVDDHQRSKSPAKVAVIGYGNEGKEAASGLRRAGHDVVVGIGVGGMSWVRAQRDGFRPKPSVMAVDAADVVALHVPDEEQCSVYWHVVAPHVAGGTLLVYGRALALATGAFEPKDLDVVVVTGDASSCRVAVHTDVTGRALDRAIAYARAAFGPYAHVGTTTIAAEAEREITALEASAGGAMQLGSEIDRALAHASESHAPDEARLAFYEGLREMLAHRAGESAIRFIGGQGARRGVA